MYLSQIIEAVLLWVYIRRGEFVIQFSAPADLTRPQRLGTPAPGKRTTRPGPSTTDLLWTVAPAQGKPSRSRCRQSALAATVLSRYMRPRLMPIDPGRINFAVLG